MHNSVVQREILKWLFKPARILNWTVTQEIYFKVQLESDYFAFSRLIQLLYRTEDEKSLQKVTLLSAS